MKHLMTVLISALATLTSSCQIQLGAKAGANFSTLVGTDAGGADTKVGFQGGLLVAIPLPSAFHLQPEVNYSIQGSKTTESGANYNLTQNYLNVPVLVKYNHKSGFFAETGPQIGFLVSAKLDGGGKSFDIKGDYKPIDLSWAFGIGYLVKSIDAGIDVRYNLGLNNNVAGSYSLGGTIRNSVIQVGIFYMFGSGKLIS